MLAVYGQCPFWLVCPYAKDSEYHSCHASFLSVKIYQAPTTEQAHDRCWCVPLPDTSPCLLNLMLSLLLSTSKFQWCGPHKQLPWGPHHLSGSTFQTIFSRKPVSIYLQTTKATIFKLLTAFKSTFGPYSYIPISFAFPSYLFNNVFFS